MVGGLVQAGTPPAIRLLVAFPARGAPLEVAAMRAGLDRREADLALRELVDGGLVAHDAQDGVWYRARTSTRPRQVSALVAGCPDGLRARDLADLLGITVHNASAAASRAVAAGWVRRIRLGQGYLYVPAGESKTPASPSAELALRRWLEGLGDRASALSAHDRAELLRIGARLDDA